ncbi:MAG TPA: redoxin domain-containing protein [Tepidisphaeraceae bacterium]|jgi:thiol-disulfide isomerase/thioredoxin
MFRLMLIGCLIGIPSSVFALQDTGRADADVMLKAYGELTPPQVDRARTSDQAYVQEYLRQRQEWEQKRSEMAKAFFDKYPDHPAAMHLMQERWIVMARQGKTDDVLAETQKVLDGLKDDAKKADVLSARAGALLMGSQRNPDNPKVAEAIDQFIKAAPTDPRGGGMLAQLAEIQTDPAKQTELYRRVIKQYPGSDAAKMAQGTLRRADDIGKPFELKFTDAVSGTALSMSDLKGKVVVVDFWATWCGPCVGEMPHMKELYAQYKDKGVEFIGVSLDEPESQGGLTKLKAFVKDNSIAWPQYYQGNGWQSEFSSSWGVNSIPCVFVIDADGKLHSTEARGQLEKLIPELLAKRNAKSST